MKKTFKKRISLLLILLTILLFNSTALNVEASAPEKLKTSASDTYEVPKIENLQYSIFDIDYIDIKIAHSKIKVINKCPLKKFQVWLNYKSEWFLLKNYDDDENTETNCFREIYTWNLKEVHNDTFIKNKFSNIDDNETFSIFVRCKGWYANQSFSKTFFRINNTIREFNLFTSNDVPKLYSESIFAGCCNNWNIYDYLTVKKHFNLDDQILKYSDFPVVATVGKQFYMFLFSNSCNKYSIKIIGDDYNQIPQPVFCFTGNRYVKWVPNKTGNFKIIVEKELDDGISDIVMEKKIYVNSADDNYAQITNFNKESLNVKLSGPFPLDIKKANKGVQMKFTIRDPFIWSKTPKDYCGSYNPGDFNLLGNINDLQFNSGNYNVTSYIKYPKSIEYDDAKQVIHSTTSASITLDLKQTLKDNKYTFTAWANNNPEPDPNLEYCFILRDCDGYKLLKNYTDLPQNGLLCNQWIWSKPPNTGTYTIYSKVRLKDDAINEHTGKYDLIMPNSYEEQDSIDIEVKDDRDQEISIESVKIDYLHTETDTITIADHKMHTIRIGTNKDNYCSNSRLQYKVYAVHDGVMRLIQGYTPNNLIPFYPQSKGEYNLIVLVKDSKSGAYEDKKEIVVNVQ